MASGTDHRRQKQHLLLGNQYVFNLIKLPANYDQKHLLTKSCSITEAFARGRSHVLREHSLWAHGRTACEEIDSSTLRSHPYPPDPDKIREPPIRNRPSPGHILPQVGQRTGNPKISCRAAKGYLHSQWPVQASTRVGEHCGTRATKETVPA